MEKKSISDNHCGVKGCDRPIYKIEFFGLPTCSYHHSVMAKDLKELKKYAKEQQKKEK